MNLIAGIFLFIGISIANAFGGIFNLLFFCACLFFSARYLTLKIITLCTPLAFAALVISISSLQSDFTLDSFSTLLRPFIEAVLITTILIYFFNIKDLISLLKIFQIYLILQVVSILPMIFNPELRDCLLTAWYNDQTLEIDSISYAFTYRGYGFSRHHLFGLPFACAFMAGILFLIKSKHNSISAKYTLVYLLFATIISILNARTAVFLVLIVILLELLKNPLLNFIKYFIMIMVLAYFIDGLFKYSDLPMEIILESISNAIDDVFYSDGNSSTLSNIFSQAQFPGQIHEWLFGIGKSFSFHEIGYSDSGLVTLIQKGGLISLFFVIYFYCKGLMQSSKMIADMLIYKNINFLKVFMFSSLILASVKTTFYVANEFSRILIILYIMSAYHNYEVKALRKC